MKVIDVDGHEPPHGNTAIWRYTGIEKFLNLILTKRLFFANAQHMSDRREVTVPERSMAVLRKSLEASGLSRRDLEEELIARSRINACRDSVIMNCWSINRNESYALWKIYLLGSSHGIAIRSTVSRLKKALEARPPELLSRLDIGRVDYTDFIKPSEVTVLKAALTKSHFYEFEKELRLLATFVSASEGESVPFKDYIDGLGVPIEPRELIEKIYLSPFSAPWFESTFRALLRSIDPALEPLLVLSEVQDE